MMENAAFHELSAIDIFLLHADESKKKKDHMVWVFACEHVCTGVCELRPFVPFAIDIVRPLKK